ncbi:MAG: glycosyltransferase family 39 protein [Victivallales bacterium]|nr:glycosyltransferase family 39 protein [Victivallales bacterium]
MVPKKFAFFIFVYTLLAIVFSTAPLTDPSESRYAMISKNMAESGDWVTPIVFDDGEMMPFLGKPPLAFQAGALCIKIFGANEFSARLPSFLSAIALLAVSFLVLRRYAGVSIAETAVYVTAATPFFMAHAGLVLVDMPLAFFTTSSLLCYYAFLCEDRPHIRTSWSMLVFVSLAFGFLTKGPVAIISFGLPVFIWTLWNKKWDTLKLHSWLIGSLLFALIVAPWFLLCEFRNSGFLRYFFINENFLRYISEDYGDRYGGGHEYPYGTALVFILPALLPWVLGFAFLCWQRRSEPWGVLSRNKPSALFALTVLSNLAFWCFARQIQLTYMLPLIPMFAIWLAFVVAERKPWWLTSQAMCAFALTSAAILASVMLPLAEIRSTKQVNEFVRDTWGKDAILIYAEKIPASAMFYFPENILLHPPENGMKSVGRLKEGCGNTVLAIKEKDLKELPGHALDGTIMAGSKGNWLLFRKASCRGRL